MKRAYTVTLAVAALLTAVAIGELHTSYIQSRFFSQLADKLSYELQADESRAVIFPTDGPYNIRQCYTRLPAFSDRLRDRGYQISRQARFSPALMHYVQLGGHPPFEEKTGAGLTITDEAGRPVFSRSRPRNLYGTFQAIPPVLVDSLLFIENRELLLGDTPTRNPAVEWKRLADAIVLRAANTVLPERPAPGGSTLATQMEKYRYSPPPENRAPPLCQRYPLRDGVRTQARGRRESVVTRGQPDGAPGPDRGGGSGYRAAGSRGISDARWRVLDPGGGKTGTTDHRSKIFATGGRLVDSRVVNRNAIFTFFIGDRYFGNLMVHVGGAKAEDFAFTSALPVQLFVSLEPALQPLLAVGEHHLVSAR